MNDIYDVIVIGGGIAGMMAALTACGGTPMSSILKRPRVLILEKNSIGGIAPFGGPLSITKSISIPGGKLSYMMNQELEELGVKIKKGEEVIRMSIKKNSKIIYTNCASYKTKIVIIACGIFPHSYILPEKKVAMIVDTYDNQPKVFLQWEKATAPLRALKRIGRLFGLTKPLLLVGACSAVYGTQQRIQKTIKTRHVVTKIDRGDAIVIDPKEYAKIVFDYNSYKLRPPTTKFLKKIGLRLKNGYIVTDQEYQTNIPGVLACGNIVFPVSGNLQALYSGFIAGITAHKLLGRGKNIGLSLFPWLSY